MPDGTNVTLQTVDNVTTMAEKPKFVLPTTRREGRKMLAQELITALRERPRSFSVSDRYTSGDISRLRDNRAGMVWSFSPVIRVQLYSVDGCGCSHLGLGLADSFRVRKAAERWDRENNGVNAYSPECHEAVRLWKANNPTAS